MDKSEVKAWVDENLERLRDRFGLWHWRLDVDLRDSLEAYADGFQPRMRVTVREEYERAQIAINYPKFDDIEDLEESFRHELMHIVHSPFHVLYDTMWEVLTEEQQKVFGTLYQKAQEMTVRNMERMYASLTEKKDA